MKVNLLQGIIAQAETGQDHTSLGAHVLQGGLTLELRGHNTARFH